MSYQFDTSRLQVQGEIKAERNVASTRLLSRRTARQARRALRSL